MSKENNKILVFRKFKGASEADKIKIFAIMLNILSDFLVEHYKNIMLDEKEIVKFIDDDYGYFLSFINKNEDKSKFSDVWRNKETDDQFQSDALIDINLLIKEVSKNKA